MASLPQTLYSTYSDLGTSVDDANPPQYIWKFTAMDKCGIERLWGSSSQSGCKPSGHWADVRLFPLVQQGQQAIAARGATVDFSDAVNASNLQAVGTVHENAVEREADITPTRKAVTRPSGACSAL